MIAPFSLTQKIWLLTLLPVILLTALLTYYHNATHLQALKQTALENSSVLSELLADKLSASLERRDHQELNRILEQFFDRHTAVLAVHIHSQDNGYTLRREKPTFNDNPALYQKIPIVISSRKHQRTEENVIGYIEAWFLDQSYSHFFHTLLNSLIIMLFVILVTVMFAIPVTQRLIKPLRELTRAFSQAIQGNFGLKITEKANNEILELQNSFNELSEVLSRQQDEFNVIAEQMTSDLQTTLQTVEIQNVELDIARREAVESSRVKSEFLANMSHEIRTPMNAIVGYTELLRKSHNVSGEDQHNTEIISRSAHTLLQILNDILDFSKLEAGKIQIINSSVNLRECLSEIIQIYRPMAHAKHLDLVMLIYDDLPSHIEGDRLRIIQIIGNLLSNAIKFTTDGQIILRVMLEEDEDNPAELIRFAVTDTGSGIDSKDQQALFRPFKQLNQGERGQSGTGLGLSISQSLATMMKGRIDLESQREKGSTFSLVIPLKHASKPGKQIEATSHNTCKGKKVLLIDSLRLSRLACQKEMTSLGLKVDALEQLTQLLDTENATKDYDLICVGLSYAEINSFESFYNRHQALFEGHRLMLMIATSSEDILERFQEDYTAICLPRPVVANDLRRHLRRLLLPVEKFDQTTSPDKAFNNDIDQVLAGRHLLVVDDNDINRSMLQKMLIDFGCKTDSSASGYDAIEKCKNHDYDLVLMDIHMPKLNGIETTQQLKRQHKNLPVIALTADVSFREHHADTESGFSGVMIKPVEMDQLQRSLIDFFTGKPIPEQTTYHQTAIDTQHNSNTIRDYNQALRITGGSAQVAGQLLNQLIELLPDYLEKINRHSASQEWNELWQSLHKLHGAASVCGVPALNHAINNLQHKVKNADYFSVDDGVEIIEMEAERLVRFVEENLKNPTDVTKPE